MRWIPFLAYRGEPLEAPDYAAALALAAARYGDQVAQVRSEVSVRISDEDRATLQRRQAVEAEENRWR